MIEVRDLTKYYGPTMALDRVSFRVEKGDIVGLLGPNGSGKTTLMRILTGFFPPTEGQAMVCGMDVEARSLEVRRRVGYLPENVVLYPDMSVFAFLEFCARVKGGGVPSSERRERVERVIDQCGLAATGARLIGKLSKGYRQRVGLAQALLFDPQVLILDEPTIGLDPAQVIEIRELIRSFRGTATVLLSTHVLPEVSVTCERVVIIDRGRIIAEDTAEGLSRRLCGSARVLVRAEGPKEEIRAVLGALPGVEDVAEDDGRTDGGCAFVLTARDERVAREAASAIVGRGMSLLEVRPVMMTLEELFVQLTRAR